MPQTVRGQTWQGRWQALGLGLLALGLVGAGFWAGGARAAGADPGSSADPLVSRSYVDQYVQFRVVNVTRGQVLLADGGTELVLRAGEATAVVSPAGGLSDLTAGKDLKQDEPAAANHLLLVPRSDGRGLRAVTDVILLVRGTYVIQGQ